MSFNKKALGVSLAISLGVGLFSWFFTRDSMLQYETMKKPFLAPPGWVFPIVWTILFILMAIAAYRIRQSDHPDRGAALRTYVIQLLLNFGWPVIFFGLNLEFLAFAWLLILWYFIYQTIEQFKKIDPGAAALLYPYLAWVTFAGYLNLAAAVL